MEDLCLDCPNEIRGLCCHINVPIAGHNIVLEHVHCPFLDKETKLCSDYENRKQIAPWCLHGEGMFGKGGLPKGCLYLKNHPEKEKKPKVKISYVLSLLPFNKQGSIVGIYNILNNTPFEEFVKIGLKQIKKTS